MECQIENVTPIGDHSLVVARVLGTNTANAGDPLVFHNHQLSGLRAL